MIKTRLGEMTLQMRTPYGARYRNKNAIQYALTPDCKVFPLTSDLDTEWCGACPSGSRTAFSWARAQLCTSWAALCFMGRFNARSREMSQNSDMKTRPITIMLCQERCKLELQRIC